jgi:hypothetical protein
LDIHHKFFIFVKNSIAENKMVVICSMAAETMVLLLAAYWRPLRRG